MRRIIASLVAAAFVTAIGTSAAGVSKPKPVFVNGTASLKGGAVVFNGSFRVKGKTVNAPVRWSDLQMEDATPAPIVVPGSPTSGSGRSIRLPALGAQTVTATFTISTPKTPTHRAAVKVVRVKLTPGGYTAVGTNPPNIQIFSRTGDPYCDWQNAFGGLPPLAVAANSPTVNLPATFHCGGPAAIVGGCHWQATMPEPPTDAIPNRDGVVTTTGLTVYGGEIACADGYIAVPYIAILFEYGDGQTWADSCELDIRGVTSFTIPPSWKAHFVSFYADLITYGPDGGYNANQAIQSTYGTRTSGSIDPCQAYHLPALKP